MSETSYRPDYAPYAIWSLRQSPVPTTMHNLVTSIATSGSIQSSLIVSEGFSLIAIGLTSTQAGTLSVQRYLDAGGAVTQGSAISVNLSAGIAANLDVMDGKAFASFKITVTNASASTAATLSNIAVLLQASDQTGTDNSADGSTALAVGGAAQSLFSGTPPSSGFAIYNPDPTEYLWVSDSTTAALNGTGSIPVPPLAGYETPAAYRPLGAVSVIAATTGHKITARRW